MIDGMRDQAERIVGQLRDRGVDYGDARVETTDFESLTYRKQRLAESDFQNTLGVGIRVLVKGCWGFASCSGFESDLVEKTVDRAVSIARAGASVIEGSVRLSEEVPSTGHYDGPCERNPFEIPRSENLIFWQELQT